MTLLLLCNNNIIIITSFLLFITRGRSYLNGLSYSRPHTINNIVNIRRIDNIIDRVRSAYNAAFR